MSTFNRSLALEEIKEPKGEVIDLFSMRHLLVNERIPDTQPKDQIVNISGNLTISF